MKMIEQKRTRGKKASQNKTSQLLAGATPKAAAFLVQALDNDELSMKERTEIAKEILNRGFGKQACVVDTGEKVIKIVLEDDVKELAE